VQNGSVSNCHPIRDNQGVMVGDMKKASILDIRVFADFNCVDIRANDALKPDTGALPDRAPTDYNRSRGKKDAVMYVRLMIFERY